MSKVKLLTVLVVGLVVLNLLVLVFMVVSKPDRARPPHGEGPRNAIIEKLHFDEQQVQEYDHLIDWHRGNIDLIQDSIFELKKQLYASLKTQPISNDSLAIITQKIATFQQHIETIHYKHFSDIKALCREDQLKDFEHLSDELLHLFSPPRRRPNQP